MKRIIILSIVVLYLFTGTVTFRPLMAEETAVQETDSELPEEETYPDVEQETDDDLQNEEPVIQETEEGPAAEDPAVEEDAPVEEETEPVSEEEGLTLPEKGDEQIDGEAEFIVPEDLIIKESDREGKRRIKENVDLEAFASLTEGEDYVARQLFFLANDKFYAQKVAEVYHASLTSFEDGVAVITIEDDDLSVKDAFLAALDEELDLPLVEPNYIIRSSTADEEAADTSAITVPEVKDWSDWVSEMNDPYLQSPGLQSFQWHHTMIHSYAAWNTTKGNSNMKVAVIGHSVNPNHEELSGKTTLQDVYSNSYASGQGTHMAAIIAGKANNGRGGVGIAPNVGIIGINIFDENTQWTDRTTMSWLVSGLSRANSTDARIVCVGAGTTYYSSSLYFRAIDIINNRKIIVASAGDESSNIKVYPAAFDNVIGVAAVDKNGRKTSTSSFGPWVTIAAPGSQINSAVSVAEDVSNTSYKMMSGTGQAAAVVSGAIALYLSKMGTDVTPDQLFDVLKESTNKSTSSGMGFGIIDLEKMFKIIPDTPNIKAYKSDGQNIPDPSSQLPKGAYITLSFTARTGKDFLVYTTDGTKPVIKDGVVTNGQKYTSRIDVDDYPQGTTLTIKAAIINDLGAMGKIATFKVKMPKVEKAEVLIKTVKLDHSAINLDYYAEGNGRNGRQALSVYQLVNANGANVNIGSIDHIFVSSNEKVASVDQNGYVTAKGPGTAKITLKIQDGSKKSAVCSVKVTQKVASLSIDGPSGLSAGSSSTYKAVITPSKAKNKNVTWSIGSNNIPGVSINAKTGKLSIPAGTAEGSLVTISAKTADGSNIFSSKTIRVVRKTSYLKLTSSDNRIVRNKKSNDIVSATIFTADLKYTISRTDNVLQLGSDNDSVISPVWSSSNETVAKVDQNGKVTAVKAGKTTITCKANDGSGKKASMTVKVIIPASGISLGSEIEEVFKFGKSMKLTNYLKLGDHYGTPTVKKVEWKAICIYYYDYNWNQVASSADNYKKYISLSKNGVLKVSKSILSKLPTHSNYILLDVAVYTTDNSLFNDRMTIAFSEPVKTLKFAQSSASVKTGGSNSDIILRTDQMGVFEVTSSNPNVAGAVIEDFYYDGKYYNYWVRVMGYKKGSATIKVKSIDGSGKSASIKINVK